MDRTDKQKASPATRKLAKDLGIDLLDVKANNEDGRITVKDLEDYIYMRKKLQAKERITNEEEYKKQQQEIKQLEDKENYIKNINSQKVVYDDEPKVENITNNIEYKPSDFGNNPDIIQFLIKNPNSEEENEDNEKQIVINYDKASHSITQEKVLRGFDEELMNNKESVHVEDKIYSKEYDNNDSAPIPLNISTVNKVVMPNKNEYIQNEDKIEKVIVPIKEDYSNTPKYDALKSKVPFGMEDEDSFSLGINTNIIAIKEMLDSYNMLSEENILYALLKIISFCAGKHNIEEFNKCFSLFKYDNGDLYCGKVENISSLKISQIKNAISPLDNNNENRYKITDLSTFNIDYILPKTCDNQVQIILIITDTKAKVFINADKTILPFNTCGKLLTSIKSVIKNPSLMVI